jgi:hypothetical protein
MVSYNNDILLTTKLFLSRLKTSHKHAEFYYEIVCIVGYIKMSKSDKFCRLENTHS